MRTRLPSTLTITVGIAMSFAARAAEYHVAVDGNDANAGSPAKPFRTIQHAADLAQPGDTITVYEGIYRERINPPRGGTSDAGRIVYRGAPGEKVVITGSEVVSGWAKVNGDTWKVTPPGELFDGLNPYRDVIHGDWFDPKGRVHHTGAVYLNGDWLTEAATLAEVMKPAGLEPLWFTDGTAIWAQFPGVDPNRAAVEITVRQTVFYPSKPGINYITVRGFTLEHAAPNWAPPTAEQVGLIGTHWSKGWIIENNTIRYSACSGVTLGKYGDEFDNTSANSAEGYVDTIKRALENGWSKEKIGHHIVRNNHISHCEQGGIVGSMGAAFSIITGNHIHDVWVRRLFAGAEMAGIKFHGAVDTVISHNQIHRAGLFGIWLDWMTQGTRVTGNLLYDNWRADLFSEVNHGPYLVDNNIMLSKGAIQVNSQGGAFAHNLICGDVTVSVGERRLTPHLLAHSTALAGLAPNPSGDDRYYNNLLVGYGGLSAYDSSQLPVVMGGNIFLAGATPSKFEEQPLVLPEFNPGVTVINKPDGTYLEFAFGHQWAAERRRPLVTTKLLGTAKTPDLPFVQPDDSSYRLDIDYFGNSRDEKNPFPGPFAANMAKQRTIKVWPTNQSHGSTP